MTSPHRGLTYSSHGTATRDRDEHWATRGACNDEDPELFYAPEDERKGARAIREAVARSVCDRCLVKLTCREEALNAREAHGVWGGLTEDERRALLNGKPILPGGCGTGGGRKRHKDDGTPMCRACLDYEQRLQVEAALRRWTHVGPLIDRGLTYEQAALRLGLSVTTVRRTHQIVKRQQRERAA